jgi:predicted Zn-dependent peptidase
VVSAAGAVDHATLVADVEKALSSGGWSLDTDAEPVARRSSGAVPIRRGSPLAVVPRPTEQTHLLLGVPGLTAGDDRRVVLGVLNSVLGGGMSSRLFQEVRERRGMAYSVYSYSVGYSDAGVFGLYAACAPAKARSVGELMLAELHRMAEHGIERDELRRAVGQLSGASALALEDSDTRMTRLGRSELTLGEFADLDESLRRLALVTPESVQELAAELAARPLSVAAVGSVDDDTFAGLV